GGRVGGAAGVPRVGPGDAARCVGAGGRGPTTGAGAVDHTCLVTSCPGTVTSAGPVAGCGTARDVGSDPCRGRRPVVGNAVVSARPGAVASTTLAPTVGDGAAEGNSLTLAAGRSRVGGALVSSA